MEMNAQWQGYCKNNDSVLQWRGLMLAKLSGWVPIKKYACGCAPVCLAGKSTCCRVTVGGFNSARECKYLPKSCPEIRIRNLNPSALSTEFE